MLTSLLAENIGFVLNLVKAFWSNHLSRTYLAHHELESKFVINIIIITTIIIIIIIIISSCSHPNKHFQKCLPP